MAFLKNKDEGDVGENLYCSLLSKNSIPSSSHKGKLIEYDVISELDGVTFYTEVKRDLYSKRSGNIAIEFWNTNSKNPRPSGIEATKADLWCHIIKDKQDTDILLLTSVAKLKDFVKTEKPLKTIGAGGDGNAAMEIYTIEHISTIFIDITNQTTEQLKSTIMELLNDTNHRI